RELRRRLPDGRVGARRPRREGALMVTAAESLATWATSVDPAALAPSVVHAAKRCVLDAVACALAGADMPWVERVLTVARAQESPGRAFVLGRADLVSAPLAAPLHGTR